MEAVIPLAILYGSLRFEGFWQGLNKWFTVTCSEYGSVKQSIDWHNNRIQCSPNIRISESEIEIDASILLMTIAQI